MFSRKQRGERLHLLGDDFQELHHDPRALLRILRGPRDLRGLGIGHNLRHLVRARERYPRLNLSRVGSINIRKAAGLSLDAFARGKMTDMAHDVLPMPLVAFQEEYGTCNLRSSCGMRECHSQADIVNYHRVLGYFRGRQPSKSISPATGSPTWTLKSSGSAPATQTAPRRVTSLSTRSSPVRASAIASAPGTPR